MMSTADDFNMRCQCHIVLLTNSTLEITTVVIENKGEYVRNSHVVCARVQVRERDAKPEFQSIQQCWNL